MFKSNIQDKINKVATLVVGNDLVQFDKDTTTFLLTPCNCKFVCDFSQDMNVILYKLNDYILEKNYRFDYRIPFVGNFGLFIIQKLQQLTETIERVSVLSNGDVELIDTGVTIKLDMFLPFKTILKHINETIADVEKNHHIKIGRVRYVTEKANLSVKKHAEKQRRTGKTQA